MLRREQGHERVTVADKPAASATLTCVHRPPPNQSQVKASEAAARQPSATSAAVHVGTECNKPLPTGHGSCAPPAARRVHPRSKRGWRERLRSLLQCGWSAAGAPALVTAVRCHRRDTAQRPTDSGHLPGCLPAACHGACASTACCDARRARPACCCCLPDDDDKSLHSQ
eukprot:SAG25_NODE_84_length_16553_cov_5.346238_16_plen_170_part_00